MTSYRAELFRHGFLARGRDDPRRTIVALLRRRAVDVGEMAEVAAGMVRRVAAIEAGGRDVEGTPPGGNRHKASTTETGLTPRVLDR